jgi:hypothetical protein
VIGFFDHNGKGLAHVPGVRSSLGLPATVTRPGRCGCLNCLWLPRVATSTQLDCWRRWHELNRETAGPPLDC